MVLLRGGYDGTFSLKIIKDLSWLFDHLQPHLITCLEHPLERQNVRVRDESHDRDLTLDLAQKLHGNGWLNKHLGRSIKG